MKTRISAAIALALTFSVMPVSAYHTASYIYDVEKPVTMKGPVTEVEWKQPHVIVHLDMKTDNGSVVNWSVEMAGPLGGMNRRGVTQDFLKPGDAVSMTVCVAKDGSRTAAAHSISVPGALEDRRVGIC
jgi:hypothetical protein